MPRSTQDLIPLHPGEVLRDEFLVPMAMTASELAERCHVPRVRIESIAAEEVAVSADTALRLGAALGTSPEFWLNLQSRYDLDRKRTEIGDELNAICVLTPLSL